MSDGEAKRPRRAWASHEPETDAFDDTPVADGSRPRRGSSGKEPEVPGLGDEPAVATRGSDAVESVVAGPANPFARPGSEASEQAAPVEPEAARAESTPIPAPTLPRTSTSAIPSPAPRRSAMSSTTPVEAETAEQPHWLDAHRRRLIGWALGGLAVALILALIAFFVARGIRGTEPSPSPTPTATTASPSASASQEPTTVADLLTPDDLTAIAPAASWSEVATTQSVAEHKSFAFCLTSLQTGVNPTHSLQRSLATQNDDKLAALHQIDIYADEAAASSVLQARIGALSNCASELVPARIVGSSTVTGLATQTFEINLVTEDATPDYRTLLLTQEGSALQLLEVRRLGETVPAEALATALVRPQQAINKGQGVEAEVKPVVAAGVVPPAEPAGWLVPSDLPRVRPGAGLWSASGQQPLSGTFGTGCENMSLVTESGPTERELTHYQLAQDDQAPALFGLDQAVFTFESPEAAGAFNKKLVENIASCKSRLLGSTIKELPAVSSTGKDGATASSRIFQITRAQSEDKANNWQATITITGARVSYSLVTVAETYKFSDAQLAQVADRIAVRLTQAG